MKIMIKNIGIFIQIEFQKLVFCSLEGGLKKNYIYVNCLHQLTT
jgi:hypothetical protein